MRKTTTFRILLSSILLTVLGACGNGGSLSPPGQPVDHICTLPCLEAAPALDKTIISSATGGTVKVTFILRGDITNVSNVEVMLLDTDMVHPVAGTATLLNPVQVQNTLDIIINAGTASATYYPMVNITANAPANSGTEYYQDMVASSTNYSFVEVVDGVSSPAVVTGYVITFLQVQ